MTAPRLWRACAVAVATLAACSGGDEAAPNDVTGVWWVLQPPASVQAGEPFTVAAEVRDSKGDLVTGATGTVGLSLGGITGISFSGPHAVQVKDGLATFADLIVTQAANALVFTATSGTASGVSAGFAVLRGPASAAASRLSPSFGNLLTAAPTVPTVAVTDEFGNAVGGATVTVSSSMPGASFTPSSGTSSQSGVFTTSFRPNSTGPVSVTAEVNGVPIATPTAFLAVPACASVPMTFPGSVGGVQPCGNYIGNPFAPSIYSFNSPGGIADFRVQSAFTPLVSLTTTAGSNDILFLADQFSIALQWMLPAGTYEVNVGTADIAGRFTLTGSSAFPDPYSGIRILGRTGTYDGLSLGITDFDIDGFGSWADRYIFRAPGPCTVTVRATGFAAYVHALDAVTGATVGFAPNEIGADAVLQLANCRGTGTNPVLLMVSRFDSSNSSVAYSLILEQPLPPTAAAVTSPFDAGPPIPISTLLSAARRR